MILSNIYIGLGFGFFGGPELILDNLLFGAVERTEEEAK